MRRPGPRSLATALQGTLARAAPGTRLSQVQACWVEAVGEAIAEQATPVSERGGTVTVSCRSSVWANELELLGPELLERLNGALRSPTGRQVSALRFRAS